MRVRAYPPETTPPSADAIVVAKRWHRYVVDWPAHGRTSG
jgi:hypothetical protein